MSCGYFMKMEIDIHIKRQRLGGKVNKECQACCLGLKTETLQLMECKFACYASIWENEWHMEWLY